MQRGLGVLPKMHCYLLFSRLFLAAVLAACLRRLCGVEELRVAELLLGAPSVC